MIALVDICKNSIYKVTMKSVTNAIWTIGKQECCKAE